METPETTEQAATTATTQEQDAGNSILSDLYEAPPEAVALDTDDQSEPAAEQDDAQDTEPQESPDAQPEGEAAEPEQQPEPEPKPIDKEWQQVQQTRSAMDRTLKEMQGLLTQVKQQGGKPTEAQVDQAEKLQDRKERLESKLERMQKFAGSDDDPMEVGAANKVVDSHNRAVDEIEATKQEVAQLRQELAALKGGAGELAQVKQVLESQRQRQEADDWETRFRTEHKLDPKPYLQSARTDALKQVGQFDANDPVQRAHFHGVVTALFNMKVAAAKQAKPVAKPSSTPKAPPKGTTTAKQGAVSAPAKSKNYDPLDDLFVE